MIFWSSYTVSILLKSPFFICFKLPILAKTTRHVIATMDSRMHLVDFVDNLSMTLYGSKKCPQFLPCEESDGLRQTAMQAQPRAVNASLTPQLEETTLTENLNTTTNVQTNSILSGRTNPSKAPTRSRRTENRQKWASIKQEVHQLYVLEAKTLQATITIIQQRHSFTSR